MSRKKKEEKKRTNQDNFNLVIRNYPQGRIAFTSVKYFSPTNHYFFMKKIARKFYKWNYWLNKFASAFQTNIFKARKIWVICLIHYLNIHVRPIKTCTRVGLEKFWVDTHWGKFMQRSHIECHPIPVTVIIWSIFEWTLLLCITARHNRCTYTIPAKKILTIWKKKQFSLISILPVF